jgi:hypothetical protein
MVLSTISVFPQDYQEIVRSHCKSIFTDPPSRKYLRMYLCTDVDVVLDKAYLRKISCNLRSK